MRIDKVLTSRSPTSPLLVILLGILLSSCASSPTPADLENLVHVFNVYQTGQEALPREVEGCEYLGGVSASIMAPEAGSVAFVDPKPLLEVIRSRAHWKGADTAFVSMEPGRLRSDGSALRATVFRCGDSTGPQTVGSPVR
jgi:hypothetical protein